METFRVRKEDFETAVVEGGFDDDFKICTGMDTYKSARVSNLLSPKQKKYFNKIVYKQDSYKILEHYISSLFVSPYSHLVIRRAV